MKGGYPLVVALTEQGEDGKVEYPYDYTIDGRFLEGAYDHNYDLVMCPEKHEGWVNVYRFKNRPREIARTLIFDTEEEAKAHILKSHGTYITTTKIQWEE